MSLVSVILVHYRDPEGIAGALASVRQETHDHDLEIFIVDNEGSETAQRRLLAEAPDAHWIAAPQNPGFAAAVNLALAEARGEWILLLNPDTRLQGPALDTCLAVADGLSPAPDVLGCSHHNRDGSFQRSAYPRATWPGPMAALANQPLARPLLRRFAPAALAAKNTNTHRREQEVSHATDAVQGSFLLARREAALAVGGFDPDFFLYCEEIDFCRRIRARGGQVFFCAEASVSHGGDARRSDRARRRQAALSEDLFVWKAHGPPGYLAYLLLRYLNLAGALVAWPLLDEATRRRTQAQIEDWRPLDPRHLLIPLRYGRRRASRDLPLRSAD
ncbi:MAG: glycosyltransferase family 2 protein [Deltaproteobacteria bacterium]